MQLFKFILLNESYHLLQYIYFENLSAYVEVTTKIHVSLDFFLVCLLHVVHTERFYNCRKMHLLINNSNDTYF